MVRRRDIYKQLFKKYCLKTTKLNIKLKLKIENEMLLPIQQPIKG